MRSKKLIALTIAPLFAIGMAACETDTQDDWTTEEGQLPAYEQPSPYDEGVQTTPRDTLIYPEHPEGELRTPEEPVTQPQPQTGTEPRY